MVPPGTWRFRPTPMSHSTLEVFARIDREKDAYLEELKDYLRIPSISTDPGYAAEVGRCADWLIARMKEAVQAMRTRGVAILLSEQNLAFVARLADRAVLIEQGHIVGTASRDEIEEPSAAIRRVLGIER